MTDISFLVDLLTLLAIFSGVLFGVAEVRRSRISRRDEAAMHIFESPLFINNIDVTIKIYSLPENASAELIYEDEQLGFHAINISTQMESWGIQVYHNKIELHTLDLMVGSTVRKTWNRLQNYIYDQRRIHETENIGEWFQWLAERLERYPSTGKELGAHVAFDDWKP